MHSFLHGKPVLALVMLVFVHASPWYGATATKKVMAFYFPQFHEFEENNRFWGKGFTDLTNVAAQRLGRYGQPLIRPSERGGLYDLTRLDVRSQQAHLAKRYGIDGFVIMHYWFNDRPVMQKPLELMLQQGPDMPFCLMWANEPWTRRWDGWAGTNDPAVMMQQTYNRTAWEPHFLWLLPFLAHPYYIRHDNKPVLVFYRMNEVAAVQDMLALWRKLALAHGLPGLHIIQMAGGKWNPTAHNLAPESDGILEYLPSFYNGPMWPMHKLLSTKPTSAHYYYGAHASWDNTPRHRTDGRSTQWFSHPSVFKYMLRQNLARTHDNGFVFINAWNEWGEGASIEPSIEWGRKWLEAVRAAKQEESLGMAAILSSTGHPIHVPLQRAGVPHTSTGMIQKTCIAVRTYQGQHQGMFSLVQMLNSLRNLQNEHWVAHIYVTDNQPFPGLHDLVDSLMDKRFNTVVAPKELMVEYNKTESAFRITDWVVKERCLADTSVHWLLVTNGDNWYSPDALDYLPPEYDMILMNFYSRYTWLNDLVWNNAFGYNQCCIRFNNITCMSAAPALGMVDLGGMVLNAKRYKQENVAYTPYTLSLEACGRDSCHDAALAMDLTMRHGWKWTSHPLDVCALHHNPNPLSCSMIGGVWLDDTGPSAGCYDMSQLQHAQAMNWKHVMLSDLACMCR